MKINIPDLNAKKKDDQPGEYKTLSLSYEEAIRKVVHSAGKTMVLFSGGSKVSDADLMHQARSVMENGATGLIFGRNMWQRPMDKALEMSHEIRAMMQKV